jgi:hypothetical protein
MARRAGALALLAGKDIHSGEVTATCPPTTGIAPFMALMDIYMAQDRYKKARRVFVIVDNGSDHRGKKAVKRLKDKYANCIMIHTPVHASWLNQCGLMANACLDLGREQAADDLARAAWTHGRIIDHAPLMGWARGTQALAAIWDQRFADAVRHAENGLLYVSAGVGAARIHAIHARALGACGDSASARAAMTAAEKARADADAGQDELHDSVGGEFAFDAAKLRYYQALALLDSGEPAGAEQAAAEAIALYEAIPARDRSYGCAALARAVRTLRRPAGCVHRRLRARHRVLGRLPDPARHQGTVHNQRTPPRRPHQRRRSARAADQTPITPHRRRPALDPLLTIICGPASRKLVAPRPQRVEVSELSWKSPHPESGRTATGSELGRTRAETGIIAHA